MKKCRKCKTDLVVGQNWQQHNKNNADYICHSCQYQIIKNNNKKYKGVYGIFEGNTCLYIGESSQYKRRITTHKARIKNPHMTSESNFYIKLQKHRNLTFKVLEVCNDHKDKEKHYIDVYKPLYNKNLTDK